MTISSEARKAGPYLGTGVVTSFPFSFKVFNAADVVVILTDSSGAESTLTPEDDYSVALNADQDASPGGTIAKNSPLASGYLLTITSGVKNLQPLDLTNQGGFYPRVINAALDRLTILVQQLAEQVGRSVKVGISSSVSPDDLISDIKQSASDAANSAANAASASSAAGGHASDADDAAVRAETAAAEAQGILANAVQQTTATGAAMLPEGTDAQRPATGSIPAGAFVLRGSTQSGSDYFGEYWDRVAATWKVIADRTWVGQQITAAVTAVQAWVNQQIGFAIIYPNGGTPEVTQKVFANSRYVMTNPFPGFHVICEPEIFIESPATDWFKPGWATNLSEGYGVSAGMYGANQIIVQTGTNGVAGAAGITGGTAQIAVQTSAYCRVKIRKIKGAV